MRRKRTKISRIIAWTKVRLTLPDLDQAKAAVLRSLRSPESQRGYRHAIDGIARSRAYRLTELS
jgi:hypothetical protein